MWTRLRQNINKLIGRMQASGHDAVAPSEVRAMQRVPPVLRQVVGTRVREMSCEECFALLDEFAEMLQAGKQAEDILPAVQHHLEMCPECTEILEALLIALEAAEPPSPDPNGRGSEQG